LPTGPRSRLVWYLERVVEWLSAAACGQLANPDDPFELPDFPTGDGTAVTIAHAEDALSFASWQSRTETYGLVELVPLARCEGVLLVRRYTKLNGEPVHAYEWGRGIADGTPEIGEWLRLPAVPTLPPWQVPTTWEELWQACSGLGIERLTPFWRTVNRLWDGTPHILLVGFPMPATIRGEPVAMEWQSLRLPSLSCGKVERRGFRTMDDPKDHQLCDLLWPVTTSLAHPIIDAHSIEPCVRGIGQDRAKLPCRAFGQKIHSVVEVEAIFSRFFMHL
jgi:hypothetical protein